MGGSHTSDLTRAVQLSLDNSDLHVACFVELTLSGHVAWSAIISHGLGVSLGFSTSKCCNGSGNNYCLWRAYCVPVQSCLRVGLITVRKWRLGGVR